MKYIVSKSDEGGREKVTIFDESVQHIHMVRGLEFPILVSAGFIGYDDCLDDDFKIYCYGESGTLHISSRGKQDTELCKQRLLIGW